MRLPVLALSAALLIPLCQSLSMSTAAARVEERTAYTRQQVFNGAVRFIRVDNQFQITEKDEENGYLLFMYPRSGGREPVSGSVEIVEAKDEITLVVQIPQMPEYHEQHLVDGLVRKLRADYGEPPRRKEPDSDEDRNPPEKDPDEGTDDGGPDEEAPPHEQVPRYRIKSKDK